MWWRNKKQAHRKNSGLSSAPRVRPPPTFVLEAARHFSIRTWPTRGSPTSSATAGSCRLERKSSFAKLPAIAWSCAPFESKKMDPMALILIFAAAGLVLLVGELLLPTHGVLGILGVLCFAGALFMVFRVNQWIGLGAFVALILASPFIITHAMNLWARSPVG